MNVVVLMLLIISMIAVIAAVFTKNEDYRMVVVGYCAGFTLTIMGATVVVLVRQIFHI